MILYHTLTLPPQTFAAQKADEDSTERIRDLIIAWCQRYNNGSEICQPYVVLTERCLFKGYNVYMPVNKESLDAYYTLTKIAGDNNTQMSKLLRLIIMQYYTPELVVFIESTSQEINNEEDQE